MSQFGFGRSGTEYKPLKIGTLSVLKKFLSQLVQISLKIYLHVQKLVGNSLFANSTYFTVSHIA